MERFRYLEPGFESSEMTDDERAEASAAVDAFEAFAANLAAAVKRFIMVLGDGFRTAFDPLVRQLRRWEAERRRRLDRRLHSRAYRGIVQYKKPRSLSLS